MVRGATIALALLVGCGFNAPAGVSGGGGKDDAHPSDSPPIPDDAQVFDDAPIDGREPDAPANTTCYGTFAPVCLATPLTGNFEAPGNQITIIDTDQSNMCATTVAGTMVGNACVIAAAQLTIDGTLLGKGSKTLVLVGNSITINGQGSIDVSSHNNGNIRGAGATMTCGQPQSPSGGGGGAGGSFYLGGGNGGTGGGGNGGTPNATMTLTALRGGCPGTKGGDGGGGGGFGGGGVLLIATQITVNGQIRANGAGGDGASDNNNNAGGGGGGSGGAIVLDSNSLTVNGSGRLTAQGGGGAEGSSEDNGGNRGNEETTAGQAATGGDGMSSGGGGGDGGVAGGGEPGHAGGAGSGGGGGGGGPGFVHITDPTPTMNGMSFPNFN